MDDKTNSTQPDAGSEIAIVDERTIRDKIYIIRGVKVMLDFELAEIYGYETKNFNRQVRNNAAKFEGDDFMFRLTRDELKELSRCKNFTTIQTKGVKGGSPYLPYAFTEQGLSKISNKHCYPNSSMSIAIIIMLVPTSLTNMIETSQNILQE